MGCIRNLQIKGLLALLLVGLVNCSVTRSPASTVGHGDESKIKIGAPDESNTWLKAHLAGNKAFGFKEHFLVRMTKTERGMQPVSVSDDYYKKLDKILGKIEVKTEFRLADGTLIKKGELGWEAFNEFYYQKLKKEREQSQKQFTQKLQVGKTSAIIEDVYEALSDFEAQLVAARNGRSKTKNSSKQSVRNFAPFELNYITTDQGIAVLSHTR